MLDQINISSTAMSTMGVDAAPSYSRRVISSHPSLTIQKLG
ncbi:hypothetical protein [Nostoc sp. LPT]|nr:hypothetical protein [Nostoc sp. LPT]